MDDDRFRQRLHDTVCRLLLRQGPTDFDRAVRLARRELADARIGPEQVDDVIGTSVEIVGRPDGRVEHLVHLLDGRWFSQRVQASTAGRRDLWVTVGTEPLVCALAAGPLPYAGGGVIEEGRYLTPSVVGPEGWLPVVPARGLVAVGFQAGAVVTRAVDEDDLPTLEGQQRLRAQVARHYRRDLWWKGEDSLETRPAELVRAITLVAMEDPDAFRQPLPPLDELLYDPLEQQVDQHHWRDFAACRVGGTVSFSITGMPEALNMELERRARVYGMSSDQFLIAVLSHTMWRTPFAEDMETYESDMWSPREQRDAGVASLVGRGGAQDG